MISNNAEDSRRDIEKALRHWRDEKCRDCLVATLQLETASHDIPYGIRITGGQLNKYQKESTVISWISDDHQGYLQTGLEVLQWNGCVLRGQTYDQVAWRVDAADRRVTVILATRDNRTDESCAGNKLDSVLQSDERGLSHSPTASDSTVKSGKRRILPKTPVQIKRATRRVHGELQARLHYSPSAGSLTVSVLRARDLLNPHQMDTPLHVTDNDPYPAHPSPFVAIALVPLTGVSTRDTFTTEMRSSSGAPVWDQAFVIDGVTITELVSLAVQLTVWNFDHRGNTFMGEVLLDLADGPLDNQAVWYHLEEHDDNSGRLPARARASFSTTSASLTSGSLRDSSLLVSPAASPEVPSHRPRQSPTSLGSSNTSPVPFGTTSSVGSREFHMGTVSQPDSFTEKIRRKMKSTVSKMSTLSLIEKNDVAGSDDSYHSDMARRASDKSDRSGDKSINLTKSPCVVKKGASSWPGSDWLVPPTQERSRTTSSSSILLSDDDDRNANLSAASGTSPATQRRPISDSDDVTSTLGPGQIPPKPATESTVYGDIRLGFMVSKGQLEVDIICAKRLQVSGQAYPPDTYVKTYLVEGKKVIQRKKTLVAKASYDPIYQKKIKYSAANVHGRIMKVNIWEKGGSFEKKMCRGEVLVRLDCLTLTRHTLAWYKLFPLNSTDYGSDEYLNDYFQAAW